MKEILASVLIISFFVIGSYFFHNYIRKITSKVWLIVAITLYVISLILYFETINQTHNYLRSKRIYLEFGHANILLIELMLICFIIAVVNIIWALVKRK
mgnify:FL=1|jgi:hypothetical protein